MRRLFSSRWFREPTLTVLDASLAAASLTVAVRLWSDALTHPTYVAGWTIGTIVAIRTALTLLFGLQRWAFRSCGLHEAFRLAVSVFLGTFCLAVLERLVPTLRLPRPVLILDYFFMTALAGAYRFVPRWVFSWLSNLTSSKREDSQRTIIVGAGPASDLLLRDLLHSDKHNYHVIGLVADDPLKVGTSICGKPVLGNTSQLARFVERNRVSRVLIADPEFPSDRLRRMLSACAHCKVTFKIIPASFAYLEDRITAALLHDLRPEDLLPRESVVFDEHELRALVTGRRILITGAGGSIGSEISRQLARHSPQRLVLLDINENELYLLTRSLQDKYPTLDVTAVVGDIRDAERVKHIGGLYRPHDVFHAAAHKHVPLMEDAPDEAVKNNILGSLNVAQMADTCGVERFVLISTDKAVAPSSVMGASKRVSELIVRDLAGRSKTRFTAVRFGNVLGSAGSVVPLFKQQIERGGPVTVTHPDCTRYFMTIPEAVGLVILAGLGNYGDLCVLDMGEAIRISELATNMIAMSGHIPGGDIQIVFTGLRPGEKLAEQLLTEEEEQTRSVRNKILVCSSPPPPKNLADQLHALRAAAFANNAEAILPLLRMIVPTYNAVTSSSSSTRAPAANSSTVSSIAKRSETVAETAS